MKLIKAPVAFVTFQVISFVFVLLPIAISLIFRKEKHRRLLAIQMLGQHTDMTDLTEPS